jgi:hypothetical protein
MTIPHDEITPEQLTEIADKVRVLERSGIITATVEIGGLLQSAFERTGHHAYLAWIAAEFDWSPRSAANYRNAYQFAQALQSGQYGKKCELMRPPSGCLHLVCRSSSSSIHVLSSSTLPHITM